MRRTWTYFSFRADRKVSTLALPLVPLSQFNDQPANFWIQAIAPKLLKTKVLDMARNVLDLLVA